GRRGHSDGEPPQPQRAVRRERCRLLPRLDAGWPAAGREVHGHQLGLRPVTRRRSMRILHGVLAALILVPATDVVAQQIPDPTNKRNTSVGTTAAEFLLLGSGARGMALSPAFAALTRDVEALYHNPASLPLLAGPEAALTVMPYFADTHYRWAGFALPLAGGEYGFGVSFAKFGFGDQPVYTEDDQENASQRTYSVSETVIGISLGHAFIDRFTGGVTFKLISDQLGSASAT